MKRALHPVTRILLAFAALAMIGGYFLPLWEIQLWAPQYPEGLNMKIWLSCLSGDYEIINGLNHYIGMKHIKQEMFPEFSYMGYVLAFMILMGLLPVLTGTRRWLVIFVGILLLGGGLGLFDFWRWGYDYGHDLDPKAAISVPGMSYQPPIIGYKSLLNFVAYSGPDKGGWILIVAGAIATTLLFWEFGWLKKFLPLKRRAATAALPSLLAVLTVSLPACKPTPLSINYGKDTCAECKMLLVDKHYGSAFITGKGKVYKFDDLNCLMKFMDEHPETPGKAEVADFRAANQFLSAGQAVYLKHEKLRTPMGSGVGAFANAEAARAVDAELGGGGQTLAWREVMQTLSGECPCEK